MDRTPTLAGIIETAIYVDDLDRASAFYEDVFQLERLTADDRLRAYSVAGRSVLLIFKRGASNRRTELPYGTLPAHDGNGPLHFAFSIAKDDLPAWEKLLADKNIPVEGRIQWPKGGTSTYFRDPDNHMLELATPGLWSIY